VSDRGSGARAAGLERAASATPADSVREFAVTYDYRCPFARNACEHVVAALEAGAPYRVRFWPFSLHQVHVRKGERDVWDDPLRTADLLALRVGLAVRDNWPDAFDAVHLALFAARHDRGLDLRDESVLGAVVKESGLDADDVLARARTDAVLDTLRSEHTHAARKHGVFGVPTFVVDGHAAFIRIMDRPEGNAGRARATVERLVDLVDDWPALNELKHTRVPR
jgi:hypothetical protein